MLKLCLPQNSNDLERYGCSLIFLYVRTIRIVITVSNTSAYGTMNLAGIESIVTERRITDSQEVRFPCNVLIPKFLTGGVIDCKSMYYGNSNLI